jgi:phospholipase C
MAPEYYKGFHTVYEELARHNVSSTIFWTDWSATLSFSGLLRHQNCFYTDYSEFSRICRGPAQNVPAYCFIEPQYNPSDDIGGTITPASDQHPDNDVRDGEVLIKNVYNAIRQNDELWHSSVLVILYDEHGGLYDHVAPVELPSPDGLSSSDPHFDFKLSGLRVPAVIISPYIKQGTICKEIFDHTSVISTALQLFTDDWPTNALGERVKYANTLDALLDLSMPPRDDWPEFREPDSSGVAGSMLAGESTSDSLSDLQREHVNHAISLNNSLPLTSRVSQPSDAMNLAKIAGRFVHAVGKAAIAARQELK